MKYALLSCLLLAAPLAAANPQANKTEQQTTHREIKSEQLKSWYDQNKPMTVVDARAEKYFDGTTLPKALWVPADANDADIQKALPSKSALIIVYCASTRCPASGWLYDKLTKLGYTNLYEYHAGIEDWMKHGYPTAKKQ